MTGVELIATERQRQIEVEGWTPEHDDTHVNGELAEAAACYADPVFIDTRVTAPQGWPWVDQWWKPSLDYRNHYIRAAVLPAHAEARIRDLKKAGALIAAEIDRLQRTKEIS